MMLTGITQASKVTSETVKYVEVKKSTKISPDAEVWRRHVLH